MKAGERVGWIGGERRRWNVLGTLGRESFDFGGWIFFDYGAWFVKGEKECGWTWARLDPKSWTEEHRVVACICSSSCSGM